jgi:hypothetical protein
MVFYYVSLYVWKIQTVYSLMCYEIFKIVACDGYPKTLEFL